MRAFRVTKYKSAIELGEVAEPELGPGDVLVEVHATGLNQLDEKVRAGEFKPLLPYRSPFVLGHDVAGKVLAVGQEVTAFSVGDEVWSRPRDGRIGTFAERIAIDEADVALRPRRITMLEAGALPLVALTAWQALVEIGNVGAGQKVLIHAGTGGVGTIAIQLAKHLGATVATTVSAANADFVRDLGADVVVDYRSEQFEDVLSDYDFVLDGVGAPNVLKSLQVLKRGGTVVGINGPPTPTFASEAGLNPILRGVFTLLSRKVRRAARRQGVNYVFLFMRASGEQLNQIAALIDSGAILPVIGKTIDFEDLPAALGRIGTDGTRGKTVARLKP